jgi:hypothetical protein
MRMKRTIACLLASVAMAAAAVIGLGAAPAQASTALVMAAATTQGSTEGLYFDEQTAGSSTWTREPVASGLWGTPSMTVQSNGNVLISDVDYSNNTLYFFWQGYQTTTWHQEQVSAYGAAALDPTSIAVQVPPSSGQAAYVAIVAENSADTDGYPAFTYYYSQIGKAGWFTEPLPGGYDGQVTPDIAVGPNNEFVVVFDPGIQSDTVTGFFIDVQAFGSSSWIEVHVGTGHIEFRPQVEVQPSGNIIIADEIGTLADLQGVEFYWSPAGDIDSWNAVTVSPNGGINNAGVSMADNPAAGDITITGGYSGACIPTTTQAYGPNPWVTGQIGCPGEGSGPPSIAAEANGGLIAASSGTDGGQGYFYWANEGSSTWHTEPLTNIPAVFGAIAVASYTP